MPVGFGASIAFSKSGEAKIGPSEDSFCRICSPIAWLWVKKAAKTKWHQQWTAAVHWQPTIPKSDRLAIDPA